MPIEFNVFVNHPLGFRCHFKLTEDADITPKVDKLIKWLVDNDYTPSLKTNDVINGNGHSDYVPEDEPQSVTEPVDEGVGDVPDIDNPNPGDKFTVRVIKAITIPQPGDKATLQLFIEGKPRFPWVSCNKWDVDRLVKLTNWKDITFTVAREFDIKDKTVTYVTSDKKTQAGTYYKNVLSMQAE